jgi:AcrR family transcriptional regulator
MAAMRKKGSRYHHGDLQQAALEAAAREIDLHGHAGFTLDRVGKRLGVTAAALYRHFDGREALLREVLWRGFQRFVERVDAAAVDPAVDDRLAAILHAFVAFSVENPGWFRLQFSREGAALADRQEQAHPKYEGVIHQELEALFGGDAAQVQRWFLAIWASAHGAAALAVEHTIPGLPGDAARLELADHQLGAVLEGLRSAAKRARRR